MSIETLRAERAAKIEKLKAAGMDPYPPRTNRTHTVDAFLANHAVLETEKAEVTIAGRVMSIREHGGSLFVDVNDGTAKAQLYVREDVLGSDAFTFFRSVVDVGDIIEARGMAFTTKRGMPSLDATGWRMLAKSVQQIPDSWYGLKDEDERYRKRYLDILLSTDVTERIKRRSKFWQAIRSFMLARGYLEVETPVLETTTGGADARPFETHHNALDIPVYLRISAGELWQKRLMVAGLPKVFEIGRIFRNEGMSAEHLQDYTQMESYEAYMDYRAGMNMIKDLYRHIADEVYGTRVFIIRDFTVDLDKEWELYDYCELIQKAYGIDPLQTNAEQVKKVLVERGIAHDEEGFNLERGIDLLWKQLRKAISGPGFLTRVPVYLEPLAKRDPADPRVVERFQVILAGSEMGKGFSELNDPMDQAERFAHQQALREKGDDEAQMADATYVEALEFGMPPTFGFGVSERLFSFLEGVSVREAQIFPLMRQREESTGREKGNKCAIVVMNASGLESWQVLNAVGHLGTELGIREGKSLLLQESIRTMDGTALPLNMRYALMLKETHDTDALKRLFKLGQEKGLQTEVFTREMIETTSDKKVIERTSKKNFDDVEILGVLVFGPTPDVQEITHEFPLYGS